MASICLDAGTTQDMDEVWDAVVKTIRAVHRRLDQDVRMSAFTGQGDGCWLVDRDGRPTGPAILWNDARAAPSSTSRPGCRW